MSYASVASRSVMRGRTKFIYTKELPSSTTTFVDHEKSLSLNKAGFETKGKAQAMFDLGIQGPLDRLNTSGEITDYVVTSADGSTVKYHHKNDVKTVFFILLYPNEVISHSI